VHRSWNPTLPRWTLVLAVALPALANETASGAVTGKVKVTPARYQDETVVYLKTVPGISPRVVHAMDQKGMRFVPEILTITAGDRVEFENHDGVEHSVYSPDHETFELGTFRTDERRVRTFEAAGVYTILCRIHPEMLGYVFVGQNPHAAAVDRHGRYRLADVPPGTYELAVWNSRASAPDRAITVGPGETLELDLEAKK
jgi:plastocyanin